MAKKKRINIDESDLRKSKVWAAEPSASPEYVKNVIQALQENEESDDPKAATRGLAAALAREGKGAQAEVDFVVARNGKITPVEVKAGKSGTLKSLHLYQI
jgi:hypothetical protein